MTTPYTGQLNPDTGRPVDDVGREIDTLSRLPIRPDDYVYGDENPTLESERPRAEQSEGSESSNQIRNNCVNITPDAPHVKITTFQNIHDTAGKSYSHKWSAICEKLKRVKERPSGDALPLVKFGSFAGNSRATGSRVTSLTAVIGDYDDGAVSLDEAAQRLREAGIRAMLYTTRRHTPNSPRWRVIAPVAESIEPAQNHALCDRLNGALGGILAPESWDVSRCYFYGRVAEVEYRSLAIEGEFLDVIEPSWAPIGKQGKTGKLVTGDAPTKPAASLQAPLGVSEAQIQEMLAMLDPSMPRQEGWLDVGMAIHHEMRGDGFHLWDEWSASGSNYPGSDDLKKQWDSFGRKRSNEATITILTLFKMAKDAGYTSELQTPATPDDFDSLSDSENIGKTLAERFADIALNEEDVSKMADAEFLIPNMIVRGHLMNFVAPANGGKTTIFIHLCEQLAAMDLQVFYINCDASPGDLKRHYDHASRHEYTVVAPDAKQGKGSRDVLAIMKGLAKEGTRCDNAVFIFDTLKKFADVIDKRQAAGLLKLLRSVTLLGATICLLGHTNKHAGLDGKLIFEGTGDIRNDPDELIYLDSVKDDEKNVLEVTTRPDKVRADFKPRSFIVHLGEDRRVSEPGQIIKIVAKEDLGLLKMIKQAINDGHNSQVEIIDVVRDQTRTYSEKRIRDRLHYFSRPDVGELDEQRTGWAKNLSYSIADPFEELI
jgi:hypothetical protein